MARHSIARFPDRRPGPDRFAGPRARFVDMHCHCLPDLDDGPASLDDAVILCLQLVADNMSTVVATPHQLGRFERRVGGETIRRSTGRLNDELRRRRIDLVILPGAEVRVDERIDELLAAGEILTLADQGRHLLLELPWDGVIDIEPLLMQLALRGVHAILAHPERNIPLLRHPQLLRRWLAYGIGLQITAASLTGDWGRQARRAAWDLLTPGQAVCVATDAHDDSRSHRMTMAFQALAARLGESQAHQLCVENPARVTRGERLAAVGPGISRLS